MRKLAVVLALVAALGADAQQKLTRLLRQPAIGGGRIAFSYGGDLWIADANGGEARRLTSGEGLEFFPRFSPDGNRSPSPASTAARSRCSSSTPTAACRASSRTTTTSA
jgi:hypothetical protein